MKIVDLFSGAGGWSTGLKVAGHDVIWAVDAWDTAVETYKANYPNANVELLDITKITPDHPLIQEADIIIGSPPCKSFSLLNPNRGDDLALTRKFLELAEGKPFIMENVSRVYKLMLEAGLLNDNHNAKIVSMGDYGVPQVRQRLIVSNFLNINHIDKKIVGLEHYIPKFDEIPDEHDNDNPTHKQEIVDRMSSVDNGEAYKEYGVYYRVPTEGIGWAIVNVTKSMMIHPYENRRLKVLEAGVLQTFPPDYIYKGTISEIGEQVGNAVPPAFAEYIGYHIEEHLQFLKSSIQTSLDSYF